MSNCVYICLLRKESLKIKQMIPQSITALLTKSPHLEMFSGLGGDMRDLELAQQLQTEEDERQRSEEEKREREEFEKLQVHSCF